MTGMVEPIAMPHAGFAYLAGGGVPFSNGVVALDGHVLTRVRVRGTPPLAEGLAFAASFLADQGRPLASLAACELRSPAPMALADFMAFNQQYVGLLRANGFGAEDAFPVGRSNMAPLFDPPATNTLFAFTYAVPFGGPPAPAGHDFVISGKPETTVNYPPEIVAPGDVSPSGVAAKAGYVIAQLQLRVAELGERWADITGAQAYTVHPLEPVMDVLRTSGLAGVGLALFPAYPPVIGLEFEIDVRAVSFERVV
jgi:hypothetical protein